LIDVATRRKGRGCQGNSDEDVALSCLRILVKIQEGMPETGLLRQKGDDG
jgi:urease gamma subunit